MRPHQITLMLLTVAGIAVGQILFKYGAERATPATPMWQLVFDRYVFGAVLLYGVCTLLWVQILREAALNQAYPIFSLSFVLVPLLSWMAFGETMSGYNMLGLALIVAGVVLATS